MAADWGHDGEVRQVRWSAKVGVRKTHSEETKGLLLHIGTQQ